jgi:carbonic anhydrase
MTLQRRITASLRGQALACFAAAVGLAAGLKVQQPPPVMGALPPGVPPPAVAPPTSPQPSIYDKNGVDWTDGMCFSRERQSPINFDDHIKDPPHDILKYHYEILRNVKLQMNASKGLLSIDMSENYVGEVAFNGDAYPLVRIDFHVGSEHLLKGKRYPMEIQLVHRKVDDAMKQLIIAIPVWSELTPMPSTLSVAEAFAKPMGLYYPPSMVEPEHNPVLQQFLTTRPPFYEGGVSDIIIPMHKALDLGFFVQNPSLPDSGEYIQYSGSGTTPPCSDLTTWFVRRRPMLASDSQTKAFADSIYRLTNKQGNFRAVMPVNMRKLNVYRAQWVSEVQLGLKRLPLGPNARTDKEFQAGKLADMAEDLSRDAVDYMADFGNRLRRSARGLQDNLDQGRILMTTAAPSNGTQLTDWEKAVLKMRNNMQGIVDGVKATVDKSMRRQTMKVHRVAAKEADKARRAQEES